MCGIGAFFARESVPDEDVFIHLFDYAAKRGSDGYGYTIINRQDGYKITTRSKHDWNLISNSEKNFICNNIRTKMNVGDILLFNFRAAPETEVQVSDNVTSSDVLQPIVYNSKNLNTDLVLVHNGAIASQVYKDLDAWRLENNIEKTSNIDSEAIIWAYLKQKNNLKSALENELCGGWSLILYDSIKDRLYSACSWNPFAHCYIKGVGYFIHSDNEVFAQIMNLLNRRVTKCGSVLWEDFYYHEREGYRYFEMDCDSGVECAGNYAHKFIHPTWNQHFVNSQPLYLVCASGGLDSTTTAVILSKYCKVPIHLVHFKYGHRGQDSEEFAINQISKVLDCPLTIFDLETMYKQIDSFSMLTNENIRVVTGMQPKTTNAWTCGRNMVFGALLGAFAESFILQNKFSKVKIAAGFSQLTESGVYPDNSEKFIYSLEQFWKYGTLPGSNNQISFVNVCRNITKSEQIQLLEYLDMIDILKYTVSCDRPKLIDNQIYQCAYHDSEYGEMPACGSGLLSWWAMKKLNIQDPRKYYTIEDKEYKAHVPNYISSNQNIPKCNIKSIISRLLI